MTRIYESLDENDVSSNSAVADEWLERAHLAAVAGQFVSAEALLRRVLGARPYDLIALDLLGYVLYFQDRPLEGEVACRRALEREPTRAYSMKGLGLCLAKQGQSENAISALREAISLAPNWFDPRWDLAYVFSSLGRLDEAIETLEAGEREVPEGRARFAEAKRELWAKKSECS